MGQDGDGDEEGVVINIVENGLNGEIKSLAVVSLHFCNKIKSAVLIKIKEGYSGDDS